MHYEETNNGAPLSISRRKASKRQADRLLKQLPLSERRRQLQIRQLIRADVIIGG